MLNRKGQRQDTSEEIPSSELGRNRRSTGSSSVVLGWYRNVSVTKTYLVLIHIFWSLFSLCGFLRMFFFPFFLYCSDNSYSLLADDVLGSFLLCPHPKKPQCGSLIIRFPSGLITHLIENTRKGKFLLEVIILSGQVDTYTYFTYTILLFFLVVDYSFLLCS